MAGRKDDMVLEQVWEYLSPDQEELLTELSHEHPNDIRVHKEKDTQKIVVKARMSHWLGYVKYMLNRVSKAEIKEYELICESGPVVGQD